jgi:hypothetical protein
VTAPVRRDSGTFRHIGRVTAHRNARTGHDGLVAEERTGQTVFRGGVNIDLGSRHYGLKRVRAIYPAGRLTLADGEASLWVSRFGALPRSLPLPVALTPDAACVLIRHSGPPGVTFKTPLRFTTSGPCILAALWKRSKRRVFRSARKGHGVAQYTGMRP